MPEHDIEEREDNVVIRCIADANPPATIMWRRAGKSDIVSLDEVLKFSPIMRRDAGTYACQAKNSIGSAGPLTVRLDVKCECQHTLYTKLLISLLSESGFVHFFVKISIFITENVFILIE